jgi:hypothetical protein
MVHTSSNSRIDWSAVAAYPPLQPTTNAAVLPLANLGDSVASYDCYRCLWRLSLSLGAMNVMKLWERYVIE